jgi:hypothetical protein
MKYEDIKDFNQRCEEHPDHQTGMISERMIQDRLSEEIDELRAYIETKQEQGEPVAWQWLTTAHFRKKLPKDAEKGAWNPLYTTPQQRKPLTDEMEKQAQRHLGPHRRSAFRDGWRSAEAAHGMKENT